MTNRSTFTSANGYTPDSFTELFDLSPSQLTQAQRYQTLKMKANKTTDEITEYNGLVVALQNYLITSERWNHFQDALYSMQLFIKNEVTGFVTTKQTEMNTYTDTKKTEIQASIDKFSDKGEYSSVTTYQKNNFITYQGQTYICTVDSTLNILPTNTSNWRLAAKQGGQGIQGLPGLNLVFKNSYDPLVSYIANDAVEYNGNIYYAKQASIGETPASNGISWTIFMARASILVSATAPSSPTDKQVWVDTTTNLFKYYDVGTTSWKSLSPSDASTTVKGIVQLEDSVTSTSVTKAATPNSVKTVKDSIPTLNDTVTSTSTTQAATANAVKIVKDSIPALNDTVISTSTTQAATANSVKTVNDKIGTLTDLNTTDKSSTVNAIKEIKTDISTHVASTASLTQKGHVQLSSSTTSISETEAATSKAVKDAMDKANAAIPSTEKGVANGVATLGADGKVVGSQLQLPPQLFQVGNVPMYDAKTAFTSTNSVLSTIQRWYLGRGGSVRITFNLRNNYASSIAYAQIFINGVATGVLRSVTGTTNVTFTEDFSNLKAVDLVELKMYTSNTSYQAQISTFQILVDTYDGVA